jgi:hypothetical protein
MGYKPGQHFFRSFLTPSLYGQLNDPTGSVTPTVSVRNSGIVDVTASSQVNVVHNGTGDWTAQGLIPATYAPGADVDLLITFPFGGATQARVIDLGPLDDFSSVITGVSNALAGQTLVPLSPVGRSSLEIVSGDAYLLADGRQLDFVKPPGTNWPTDLTTWAVTLNAKKLPEDASNIGSVATLTKGGTVVTATGSAQAVRFQLTSADTTNLVTGSATQGWKFSVVATNGSDRATIVTGLMTVLENVTP